jgi:hypothetical protein
MRSGTEADWERLAAIAKEAVEEAADALEIERFNGIAPLVVAAEGLALEIGPGALSHLLQLFATMILKYEKLVKARQAKPPRAVH